MLPRSVLACIVLLVFLTQSPTEVSAAWRTTTPNIYRPIDISALTATSRTSGLSTPSVKYVAITEKNTPLYRKVLDRWSTVKKEVKEEVKEELKDQAWEALKEAVEDLVSNSETLAPESMSTPSTTFEAPTFVDTTYFPLCTEADKQTFRVWNPAFESCSRISNYPFWNAPPTTIQQSQLCGVGCANLRSQLARTPAPLCLIVYNNRYVDYYSYFIQLFSRCWTWTSFSVPTPTKYSITNTTLETTLEATPAPTPRKTSTAEFPTLHRLTLGMSVVLSVVLLA